MLLVTNFGGPESEGADSSYSKQASGRALLLNGVDTVFWRYNWSAIVSKGAQQEECSDGDERDIEPANSASARCRTNCDSTESPVFTNCLCNTVIDEETDVPENQATRIVTRALIVRPYCAQEARASCQSSSHSRVELAGGCVVKEIHLPDGVALLRFLSDGFAQNYSGEKVQMYVGMGSFHQRAVLQ
ncbi:unnamed protein product [Chondrus crispus]|uniref:Uncharacterized protein n=1 Tax=Chondrus crispus TaxID=2769 RepID=R7QKJ7_CHOCR|nr:unnamed protein product [Chondrus crispus]CDF39032.1 unnamed protein product [Chondrus crispus]|eukprot:XP_005718937.1 unnamed protein product [Chondrus crispus]